MKKLKAVTSEFKESETKQNRTSNCGEKVCLPWLMDSETKQF